MDIMPQLATPELCRPQAHKDAHLSALINSLSEALLIIERSQQISSANKAWAKLTGTSVRPSQKKSFIDYIHPEDIANWRYLSEQVPSDRTEVLWLRLQCSNAGVKWCEVRLQRLHTQQPYPLTASIYDITEKLADDKLKQAQNHKLHSLINNLPGMLYRAKNNASWMMEYISQGCLYVTGYPRERLLNQSSTSLGGLILKQDASRVWHEVQAALRERKSFDIRYHIRQRSGQVIAVQDLGRGTYDTQGLVNGIEGIIVIAGQS